MPKSNFQQKKIILKIFLVYQFSPKDVSRTISWKKTVNVYIFS